MAITNGTLIEIELHMFRDAQVVMNTFQYRVESTVPADSAVKYAEAWWNHVKTTYRAMCAVRFGQVFQKVVLRELNNPVGELAEYGIIEAEQVGTRANPTPLDAMPLFNSVGVRLLVSTRATRPGQKRLPFLCEVDNIDGYVQAILTNLTVSWAQVITQRMVLGAPAALEVLQPIVTRKNAQGAVLASQPVTGYLVNPLVTTQNSRKLGRGI